MMSDSAGRIVQMVDALGNETQAAYNSLNQLTKITDARTGETRFNFDGRNNVASVVNPLNNNGITIGLALGVALPVTYRTTTTHKK